MTECVCVCTSSVSVCVLREGGEKVLKVLCALFCLNKLFCTFLKEARLYFVNADSFKLIVCVS
jgi:hypothetical protein